MSKVPGDPPNGKVNETTPKIKPRQRRNTMFWLAMQHLTQVASDATFESLRLNQNSSSQQQLLRHPLFYFFHAKGIYEDLEFSESIPTWAHKHGLVIGARKQKAVQWWEKRKNW
jgi:hypothetical protein